MQQSRVAAGTFCAVLLTVATAIVVAAADTDAPPSRLRSFPQHTHLQCGVCEGIVLEIDRRINVTNRNFGDSSYKHTQEGNTAQRRRGYTGSELQAVEVLEMLCPDISKKSGWYLLDGLRALFANPATAERAVFYSRREATQLSRLKGRVSDACEEIADKYDELLTRVVRRSHHSLEELMDGLCVQGTKLCDPTYLEAGVAAERARREAWVAAGEVAVHGDLIMEDDDDDDEGDIEKAARTYEADGWTRTATTTGKSENDAEADGSDDA